MKIKMQIKSEDWFSFLQQKNCDKHKFDVNISIKIISHRYWRKKYTNHMIHISHRYWNESKIYFLSCGLNATLDSCALPLAFNRISHFKLKSTNENVKYIKKGYFWCKRRSLLFMALPLWFLCHAERRSIIKRQEEGNNALAETSVAKKKTHTTLNEQLNEKSNKNL